MPIRKYGSGEILGEDEPGPRDPESTEEGEVLTRIEDESVPPPPR